MSRRVAAATLGAGGLLVMVGGALHPRGTGDDVDSYLASMLEASSWEVAHVALLAGIVLAVVGFVVRRTRTAPPCVRDPRPRGAARP